MNLEDILNQLQSERSRLNQAISALEGLVSGPIRRPAHPLLDGILNVDHRLAIPSKFVASIGSSSADTRRA